MATLLSQLGQRANKIIDRLESAAFNALDQFGDRGFDFTSSFFGVTTNAGHFFEFFDSSVGCFANFRQRNRKVLGFVFVDPEKAVQQIRRLFGQVHVQPVVTIVLVDQLQQFATLGHSRNDFFIADFEQQ